MQDVCSVNHGKTHSDPPWEDEMQRLCRRWHCPPYSHPVTPVLTPPPPAVHSQEVHQMLRDERLQGLLSKIDSSGHRREQVSLTRSYARSVQ
jgi:hypothetical protein